MSGNPFQNTKPFWSFFGKNTINVTFPREITDDSKDIKNRIKDGLCIDLQRRFSRWTESTQVVFSELEEFHSNQKKKKKMMISEKVQEKMCPVLRKWVKKGWKIFFHRLAREP